METQTTGNNDQGPPKISYSSLKILTGSDLSRRRLPLMSVTCEKKEPVVWLTACCHGDEVGGIGISQDLFKKFNRIPLLKGSVHAFPVMNPVGFETVSRHITPTMEDLNRSFPGDDKGSLGKRIANVIFSTIVETKPELVLDLHHDWIKSIPYVLIDQKPETKYKITYQILKNYGQQTGFPVIYDTSEYPGSLSFNLIRHNIPALTLELGEPYVVNEKNIRYGIQAIWNILHHLGMTPSLEQSFENLSIHKHKKQLYTYSECPVSSTSGIIRFLAQPGDTVAPGQPIAKIYNTFGKLKETMHAKNHGIVLGHTDSSVVFPGMAVISFGNTKSG